MKTKKIKFYVKGSEWNKMPQNTKKALMKMVIAAEKIKFKVK